jgi:hypothetical protein
VDAAVISRHHKTTVARFRVAAMIFVPCMVAVPTITLQRSKKNPVRHKVADIVSADCYKCMTSSSRA